MVVCVFITINKLHKNYVIPLFSRCSGFGVQITRLWCCTRQTQYGESKEEKLKYAVICHILSFVVHYSTVQDISSHHSYSNTRYHPTIANLTIGSTSYQQMYYHHPRFTDWRIQDILNIACLLKLIHLKTFCLVSDDEKSSKSIWEIKGHFNCNGAMI